MRLEIGSLACKNVTSLNPDCLSTTRDDIDLKSMRSIHTSSLTVPIAAKRDRTLLFFLNCLILDRYPPATHCMFCASCILSFFLLCHSLLCFSKLRKLFNGKRILSTMEIFVQRNRILLLWKLFSGNPIL